MKPQAEPGFSPWGGAPIAQAEMDVTNRFVLDFATRFARQRGGARVLDFGCGAGRLVQAGLAAGLDMAGADVYYGGSKTRAEAERLGLLGAALREIRDGRLDYATASFDLVVNNQVLEHVADLDAALAEIHRANLPSSAFKIPGFWLLFFSPQ